MNLFDNILAKANPLPDVKSQFMSGFQQPQQKKPSMTLFSDEYTMLGKMKADGLSDEESMNLLKQRRTDLLEGRTNLDPKEQSMLLKMQADKLSAKEATALLKQRRADQFEKKYQEGNLLQKGAYNTLMAGAGNLETVLKYGGNALDFVTFGQLGFGEDVKRMEQVTQSPEFDSTAFKAGTYLPDVALGVSPIGAGYLAGAKGMGQLALRSGVVGAGFGATQPILEQGSDVSAGDIATGAAVGAGLGVVATPVLAKTFKYGKAGYYGGLEGAGKSIARDVKAGVQAITPSGANISTKANRFNASEIRNFIKMTGQTPGDFATSRGMTKVGDDAVVEATNLWQASKDQADEALKAIKGRFRFTDGGEDLLKTTLDDLETRLVNTKSPDAKRISQLKAKYESSGLTMSEINEVKRAYSNNYKYSFVDAGSEGALRSRNLQDAIRKWQFKVAEENGFTNLKDINKTTQGWKAFADSLAKKIQGSSGNNAVSLTDWIALSGGNPENIALYLGKKLATSDRTKALAIKLFSKKTKPSIIQASKADIQQANFQKNVNRGVSGIGDSSGGKSLVRPVGLLPPPSGKATGARNFRANQPTEKTPITNEGQRGARPITPKKPEAQKLLPAPRIPAGTSIPRTDVSAESMRGLSSNVKRPNGNTNNTSSNSSNVSSGTKKVQKSSSKKKKIEDSDFPDDPPPPPPSEGTPVVKPSVKPPKKVVAPKKSTKGIVAPKKIENTPIVKKEGNAEVKPTIIDDIKYENEIFKQKKEIIEQLKSKEGERFAKKWGEQVDVLFPDKTNIVKYGKKGITYKEGDKYYFSAFSNTDSPKWSKSFKMDVTDEFLKPSPKPIVKNLQKTEKSAIETNITRNEAIEKGFSDSAKARWDKGEFTMKERGEATKYLKSNYKGKEYTIDGKKYKVDAIDNRNEQVRLMDSEGNIIRVKINKLPEVKVTDKDIFEYYNGRVQKGYKTILKPSPKPIVKNLQKTEKSATIGDMETKKLIEEAKSLGKYDNSYDVVKGKKLYRGGNEDGVFWTDDIDIAKSFGDEGAIEKTITIKKPLDVRSKGIRDYIKKNTDIKIDDATSAYSRSLPEFKKLMKWAKDNGYDGIIGKTSDNGLNFTGNEFVVIK